LKEDLKFLEKPFDRETFGSFEWSTIALAVVELHPGVAVS
jgi:hypothetical protein